MLDVTVPSLETTHALTMTEYGMTRAPAHGVVFAIPKKNTERSGYGMILNWMSLSLLRLDGLE